MKSHRDDFVEWKSREQERERLAPVIVPRCGATNRGISCSSSRVSKSATWRSVSWIVNVSVSVSPNRPLTRAGPIVMFAFRAT